MKNSGIKRARKIKERQRQYGVTDAEVLRALGGGSIDTLRKLGVFNFSDEKLDYYERGIEAARLARIKRLSPAG